eukprot:273871_1
MLNSPNSVGRLRRQRKQKTKHRRKLEMRPDIQYKLLNMIPSQNDCHKHKEDTTICKPTISKSAKRRLRNIKNKNTKPEEEVEEPTKSPPKKHRHQAIHTIIKKKSHIKSHKSRKQIVKASSSTNKSYSDISSQRRRRR